MAPPAPSRCRAVKGTYGAEDVGSQGMFGAEMVSQGMVGAEAMKQSYGNMGAEAMNAKQGMVDEAMNVKQGVIDEAMNAKQGMIDEAMTAKQGMIDEAKKAKQGLHDEAMKASQGMFDLEAGKDLLEDSHANHESTWMMRALVIALPLFYGGYFLIALLLCVATGTEFKGDEPFDHVNFDPSVPLGTDDDRPLVNWLSFVLMFGLAGPVLVYFGAREAERAVDMATAMQALHLFITTAATQEMPQNSTWWTTAMPLFFLQGRAAQFALNNLRRRARRRTAAL